MGPILTNPLTYFISIQPFSVWGKENWAPNIGPISSKSHTDTQLWGPNFEWVSLFFQHYHPQHIYSSAIIHEIFTINFFLYIIRDTAIQTQNH